jgi:hypothetical protein
MKPVNEMTLEEVEAELGSTSQPMPVAPQQEVAAIDQELMALGYDPTFDEANFVKRIRQLNYAQKKAGEQIRTLSHNVGLFSKPEFEDQMRRHYITAGGNAIAEKKTIYDQMAIRGYTPQQVDIAVQVDMLKNPTITESIKQDAGRYGGAMAGSAAGAKIGAGLTGGHPLGVLAGATLGAGVGAFAGKSAQQYAEEGQVDLNETTRAAGNEMLWEFGGRGIPMFFGFLGRGAVNKGSKILRGRERAEAAELMSDLKLMGGRPTPTSVLDSTFVDLMENAARGSIGGGEIFNQIDAQNAEAFVKYMFNMADEMAESTVRTVDEMGGIVDTVVPNQLPITKDSAGKKVLESFARGGEPFNDIGRGVKETSLDEFFGPLYDKIDEATGLEEKIVPVTKQIASDILGPDGKPVTRQVVENIPQVTSKVTFKTDRMVNRAKQLLKMNQYAVEKGGEPLLKSRALELVENIAGWDKEIPMKVLREYRSTWLRELAKLTQDVDPSGHVVSEFASLAKETLFDPAAAKNLAPETRRLLQNVNNLYARSEDILENIFTKKLMEKISVNPAAVVGELLPNGDSAEFIKKVRDSLVKDLMGKPTEAGQQAWDMLRSAKLAEGITEATQGLEAGHRTFDIKAFEAWLKRFGLNSANETFGPETLERIKKIGRYMESLSPSTGTSKEAASSVRYRSFGWQIRGTGAAVAGGGLLLYGSDDPQKKALGAIMIGTGGTLVIGPYAFARLAETEQGMKLLMQGVSLTPKSKGFVPFVHRVVAMLENQDKEKAKALEKELMREQIRQEGRINYENWRAETLGEYYEKAKQRD